MRFPELVHSFSKDGVKLVENKKAKSGSKRQRDVGEYDKVGKESARAVRVTINKGDSAHRML